MGLYNGRILKAINTALRHSRQNMLAVLSFDSLTLFYILNNRPLLESLSMDYCESDGFEWAFDKWRNKKSIKSSKLKRRDVKFKNSPFNAEPDFRELNGCSRLLSLGSLHIQWEGDEHCET